MSENTIKVTIPFSFKGVEQSPSAIIDLEVFVKSGQGLDSLFHLVATENNISNFSYEYEVLESSSVFFSEPKGLAAKFLNHKQFDLDGFKQELEKSGELKSLEKIAKEILDIEDLNEEVKLKEALMQAYMLGKNT